MTGRSRRRRAEPPRAPRGRPARTTVVIATRDRCATLLGTLARLAELPERPPVVVVVNGSSDATAAEVRRRWPDVTVVELARNRGASARNEGAAVARTPYVAFADDDSWWAPGALARAERALEARPRLALVAARVLVGEDERLDPTCAAMAASPLAHDDGLPGPRVLGFVACGAIVRRSAFLAIGGFERGLGIGCEEELLAIDLATAGIELAYLDEVVAHHHPAPGARPGRARLVVRNALLIAWMRRPGIAALRRTWSVLATARNGGRDALLGALDALRLAPWALRRRRPVSAPVERSLRLLERSRRAAA